MRGPRSGPDANPGSTLTTKGNRALLRGHLAVAVSARSQDDSGCHPIMIRLLQAALGVVLVMFVLWDAFESIVLPRTVTRSFRLTRFFYRSTWTTWAAFVQRMVAGTSRDHLLSFFGPLSLLLLLAVWAVGLMIGFGLLFSAVEPGPLSAGKIAGDFYLSGTTFFTLGLGDVKPESVVARAAAIVEAGIGFGFLALVIGYLPVVYAAFSRREVLILRLDVRTGSPPTAAELLRQRGEPLDHTALDALMRDFEIWSAELLEAHLSYPVLCLYRSQHRDQSWLATLTAILDLGALLIVGLEGVPCSQASVTFAMARRAALDLAHLFLFPGRIPTAVTQVGDRLPLGELSRLRALLKEAGTPLTDGTEANEKLIQIRATYEPAVEALSTYLLMPLPPFIRAAGEQDRPVSASEQLTAEQGATDVSII